MHFLSCSLEQLADQLSDAQFIHLTGLPPVLERPGMFQNCPGESWKIQEFCHFIKLECPGFLIDRVLEI